MRKIAIVTPLPPEKTGIADFSEIVYGETEKFDLFTWEPSPQRSIRHIWGDTIAKRYSSIIFVLGNSDHIIPCARLLRAFKGFPAIHTKICLQIHDPVLTNLSSKAQLGGAEEMLDFYSKQIATKPRLGCIYDAYEDHKITGLSYLIEGIRIDSIIVHSKASEEITRSELRRFSTQMPRIKVLFHPIFDSPRRALGQQRGFDVGIFGVMDNDGKMSGLALDAIEKAHSLGIINTCVCAGFNASEYFNLNPNKLRYYIHVIDNPSREELLNIMASTSIALQPRRMNTGESSGVIPMLFSQHCIPIVSDTGAFKEYPDMLIIKISNMDFVNNAVTAIHEASTQKINPDLILQYIDSQRASAFAESLIKIFE